MNRSILPARALRLTGRDHARHALGLFLLLLVLGMFAGAGWWLASEALEIGRDKALWKHGVSADGNIQAHRRSKLGLSWFISAYDGEVTYTDAAGQSHAGSFDFWTVLGGPDTDVAELRYDEKHPDQFVVNWAVEASGARWRASFAIGGLCVGLALIMLYTIKSHIQEHLAMMRVAKRGDELRLRITARSPVQQGKRGSWNYHFEVPGGEKPVPVHKQMPSVFETEPGYALALWIPGDPQHVLILRADLSPLKVTSAELNHALAQTTRTEEPPVPIG